MVDSHESAQNPEERAWNQEMAEALAHMEPARRDALLHSIQVATLRSDLDLGTYSLAEIAEAYDLSTRTLLRAIQAGELKAAKLGKQYRVTRRSLAAWIELRSTH